MPLHQYKFTCQKMTIWKIMTELLFMTSCHSNCEIEVWIIIFCHFLLKFLFIYLFSVIGKGWIIMSNTESVYRGNGLYEARRNWIAGIICKSCCYSSSKGAYYTKTWFTFMPIIFYFLLFLIIKNKRFNVSKTHNNKNNLLKITRLYKLKKRCYFLYLWIL